MPGSVQHVQFSGPLEALLKLIEQEELPITEVSLARVTQQYIAWLESLPDKSQELADFLMIGARLVYLKSRTLLPQLGPDDEAGPSLAEQLKLYREFLEASRVLGKRWQQGRVSVPAPEKDIVVRRDFFLPANVTLPVMANSFWGLLRRLTPLRALPEISLLGSVSVQQQLERLVEILAANRAVLFYSLAASRSEIIVNFLAVLELWRAERVELTQEMCYSDFFLKYVVTR